ncbi:hypothetical protein Bca101_054898 [Brassica carinata]
MDSSSTTRYDVFVSFTGEDIGRTFVSHLYRSLEQKGICAFKDETKKPFEIRLAAIRASKIAIVVVSKNYVSSTSVWWILKELQEILNYHRSGYVTVFPVYYGVDPCDVKSQAEEFAADQTQKPDKVGTWKALMELCCFSGQHSDKWKDDSELIQKITNDIWHKLSSARFGELVGMDLRMRRMYELLSIESKADQVRVIGIWGREGLGKRTLARCLYRETSHTFDVHVSLGYISRFHQENNSFLLRQKLRSELIQASGGIHMISGDDDTAWLADRRVLLVVEGVETAEQLCIIMEEAKLFGPGSRVIVICEDQHLLLASGITLLYQVEPLEFYEALELLRLRAVNHTDPLSVSSVGKPDDDNVNMLDGSDVTASEVAEYCRERIHFALAEEIERIKEELCKRNTDEDRQVLWEKVFNSCFLKVDDEVRGKISSLGVGSSDRVLEAFALQTAGSTAVVALVCSSHIIVSNCGDSRAVLFRGKECMPLSVDHKPDREDEYARIERAGGKVIQWHGARVSGFLALSRSIGDEYLKPYVIPDPEVTFMPRAKEDDCLILASDGLWDVMSNQEACKFARKRILIWHKKNEAMSLDERGVGEDHACQSAADYLSKLALRKGSKDNVSIIVIDLKPKRKFKERP